MIRNRCIIYPKDVQVITGRSERYGQNIIAAIKKKLGKKKYQLVTFGELCEFLGVNPEDVGAHFEKD